MSFPPRLAAGHLSEADLLELYGWESHAAKPATTGHLAVCASCRHRYERLGAFFGGVTKQIDAEVDDLFPESQLVRQKDSILQRITKNPAPCVLRFPALGLFSRNTAARRWVAGAAAAGFLLGILLGGSFDMREWRNGYVVARTQRVSHEGSPLSTGSRLINATDEALLSEVDSALQRSQVLELRALDDLTPHVTEVLARIQ